MMRISMAVAVACGLAAGCKKDEPKPAPTPPADAALPEKSAADDAAAAKVTARKRLSNVMFAWNNHHDQMGAFPTNTAPKAGVGLSWRVMILPLIKQEALFKQFKLDEPWDSETNKKLIDQMPDIYASAGKPAEKGQTYLRAFVGPHAAVPDKPTRVMRDIPLGRQMFAFQDGTSNTLVVAEAAEPVVWTKADDLAYDGGAIPKLGGVFPGGFHAVAAAGNVHWFDAATPEFKLRGLITFDGSEPIYPTMPDAPPPADKPKPPASKK